MNIPSNIHVSLPSIILENNSSNNAIWGQIFGEIQDQTDLIELLNNDKQSIHKIDWIDVGAHPTRGDAFIVNLSAIFHDYQVNVHDLV
jgi:hypothetical protein